jgi:DNA-binding HxlR family transcriptional regulator
MKSWLTKNLSLIKGVVVIIVVASALLYGDCNRRRSVKFAEELSEIRIDQTLLQNKYDNLVKDNLVWKDSVEVIRQKADMHLSQYKNAVAEADKKEKEWKDKYDESLKIPSDSSYKKLIAKYPPLSELKYRFDSGQVSTLYSVDIKATGLMLENLSLREAIAFCDSVNVSRGNQIDALNMRVSILESMDATNKDLLNSKDRELALYQDQLKKEKRLRNGIIIGGVTVSAALIILSILNN